MRFTSYFLVLLGVYATANAQQQYTVRGNVTGFTAPGKVFLLFRDGDRKVFDSTTIQDGKFTFEGTVEDPTDAAMYIRANRLPGQPSEQESRTSERENIRFMLEPGTVLIEGEHLNIAKVTGKSQQDYTAFHQAVDQASDSAYQVWKAQLGTLPEDSAASFHRLLFARAAKSREASLRFVLSHPDSYISYDVFKQNTVYIIDPKELELMRKALEPAFGERPQFTIAAGRLDMALKLAIGQPALPFTQTDNNGKEVSLSDVKGKYVLIDFWASWCGPCRQEYPHLKSAYAQFKDKNFEIVGVSLDDKKELWLGAIQSNGFKWIQLSDLKGRQNAIAQAYGVAAIPQNFLIDPQGKIIAKNLRGAALEETLMQVIH